GAALRHEPPQFRVLMVREVKEGRARAPLLALEQHRHERRQKSQSGNRLELCHREHHRKALSSSTIADLIVILRVYNELLGSYAAGRSAVTALPVLRVLTLVHITRAQRLRDVRET